MTRRVFGFSCNHFFLSVATLAIPPSFPPESGAISYTSLTWTKLIEIFPSSFVPDKPPVVRQEARNAITTTYKQNDLMLKPDFDGKVRRFDSNHPNRNHFAMMSDISIKCHR